MIDTPETPHIETIKPIKSIESSEVTKNGHPVSSSSDAYIVHSRCSHFLKQLRQVFRFGLVGGLNTLIDLLVLNALLLLFPATNTLTLLSYNSLAYSIGAINSFLLNKYWTFGHRQPIMRKEVIRFVITTLCSIALSNVIIWLASKLLHPLHVSPLLWANASKVFAIFGTVLVSYLGMRFWVFVKKSPNM